ncbi:MAG TPA: hypothetical protein VGD55_11615 [Acidothermaceae bacterium]
MNDEDFARRAFAAAFRSGQTGEPPTLPDVELLALHGRRANRYRHGAYAVGTTVLAGVTVVGVVGGPALLGLGSNSPSGISVGAGAPAAPAPSSSSSAPDPAKPSSGVPCATPPAINWASVLAGALPAGVTATADHLANCVQLPDGTRSVEALFKLSTGNVGLQVDVATGPEIARKLTGGAGKIGADASPEPGDSPSPNPSGSTGSKGAAAGNCSKVGPDENACISRLTKDSASVVDVQILRTGTSPIVVDVAASNGKNLATPDTGQLPSDATMLAIAEAVAAHF